MDPRKASETETFEAADRLEESGRKEAAKVVRDGRAETLGYERG